MQRLTPRELEILRLIAKGKFAKDIAAELKLSKTTVDRHYCHIAMKLGTHTVAHAIMAGLKRGIIQLEEVADPGL